MNAYYIIHTAPLPGRQAMIEQLAVLLKAGAVWITSSSNSLKPPVQRRRPVRATLSTSDRTPNKET